MNSIWPSSHFWTNVTTAQCFTTGCSIRWKRTIKSPTQVSDPWLARTKCSVSRTVCIETILSIVLFTFWHRETKTTPSKRVTSYWNIDFWPCAKPPLLLVCLFFLLKKDHCMLLLKFPTIIIWYCSMDLLTSRISLTFCACWKTLSGKRSKFFAWKKTYTYVVISHKEITPETINKYIYFF